MGIRDLLHAKPDEMCSLSLHKIILTRRPQLFLRREIRFCFLKSIGNLKPEINIHTLHRTKHLVAIYSLKAGLFFPPLGNGVCGQKVEISVCGFLVLRTKLKITPILVDAAEGNSKLLVATGRGDTCLYLTWPSPQSYSLTVGWGFFFFFLI